MGTRNRTASITCNHDLCFEQNLSKFETNTYNVIRFIFIYGIEKYAGRERQKCNTFVRIVFLFKIKLNTDVVFCLTIFNTY